MNNQEKPSATSICVIGLGYVGLPLAITFSEKFDVIGIDISSKRISELNDGIDMTREVFQQELKSTSCKFSTNIQDAAVCNVFVVGVPTPIDDEFRPDLKPLIEACKSVASVLNYGDIVIFESTVYPGTTEDVCVPILEEYSGLSFNLDFFVGYSPERINPGDKKNTLKNIPKVVSGSTPEVSLRVQSIYDAVLNAPTHLAPSIKVAEGAKIIENTQRDMNIAIMNEFSRIFSQLNINLYDVIDAAKTKWNFLPFEPGLVGGHCIGVDPYYLIEKSSSSGYNPDFLVTGRRLNETMVDFMIEKIVFAANDKKIIMNGARILILGYTFKANCPDIRNTKVKDLREKLQHWGAHVRVLDPWVSVSDCELCEIVSDETLIDLQYDIVISAVDHTCFSELTASDISNKYSCRLVFDLKNSVIGAENVYK